MRRHLHWLVLASVLGAAPAGADYLKASRVAVVHEDHDAGSAEIGRLLAGDVVDLTSGRQTDGYYHVTLEGGTDGWVYRSFVRRYAGNRPGRTDHASADGGAQPLRGAGALDASTYAATDCPPEGTAQSDRLKQLNRLKNRTVGPAPASVVGMPLEDLIFPGEDASRWKPDRAIEVVAYVYNVKMGGVETCNCGATDAAERDTHIELISDPQEPDVSQRFIVEVTPAWRRFMKATKGLDWSTSALKGSILHKWVKVRGWMLFDSQHTANATNTNPDDSSLWRATCWEIHPVSGLDVVAPPVQ